MSPLRAVHHGNPHIPLSQWIGHYGMYHATLIGSDNATIRFNADNDAQPDLCLLRAGGQTRFETDGFIVGASELIVEISGPTASYDFSEKRDVYESARLGEYFVYETIEGRVAWWQSKDRQFEDILPEGVIYNSVLFPGLWLDADALRSASALKLIQTLQKGIESA